VPGTFEMLSTSLLSFVFIALPHNQWLSLYQLLLVLGLFAITGLFANPNLLTMHRFYRDRISRAYLRTVSTKAMWLEMDDWIRGKDGRGHLHAPYPLINTCLNVLGKGKHIGAKNISFFLRSTVAQT
jgi:hypothetical protein